MLRRAGNSIGVEQAELANKHDSTVNPANAMVLLFTDTTNSNGDVIMLFGVFSC